MLMPALQLIPFRTHVPATLPQHGLRKENCQDKVLRRLLPLGNTDINGYNLIGEASGQRRAILELGRLPEILSITCILCTGKSLSMAQSILILWGHQHRRQRYNADALLATYRWGYEVWGKWVKAGMDGDGLWIPGTCLLHKEGGRPAQWQTHNKSGVMGSLKLFICSQKYSRTEFSRALRSVHLKSLTLSPVFWVLYWLWKGFQELGVPNSSFLYASGVLSDPRKASCPGRVLLIYTEFWVNSLAILK